MHQLQPNSIYTEWALYLQDFVLLQLLLSQQHPAIVAVMQTTSRHRLQYTWIAAAAVMYRHHLHRKMQQS
eukprot:scaffold667821_cov60-Prasinocladus_malaysianus.AAC.1